MKNNLLNWQLSLKSYRIFVCIIIFIFILLYSFSFFAPISSDDFFIFNKLKFATGRDFSPFNLYEFIDQDNNTIKLYPSTDVKLPWWTPPDIQIRFFRPLSSLTLYLDYFLFKENFFFYHIDSLLWIIGILLLWSYLLQRFLPRKLCLLSLFIFAVSFHGLQQGSWISCRNVIVAAFFSLLAVVNHILWREKGKGVFLCLSIFGLIGGCAASEHALSVFAYIAAYECIISKDALSRRLSAFIPAFVIGLLYIILYLATGAGSQASGLYFNPLSDPFNYLLNAPVRLLALLLSDFFLIPVSLWHLGLTGKLAIGIVGVVLLPLLGFVLFKIIRQWEADRQRALRFFLCGSLLAMLPVLSGSPGPRLTYGSFLGCSVLIAALLTGGIILIKKTAIRKGIKIPVLCFAVLFLLLHILFSPFILIYQQITNAKKNQELIENACIEIDPHLEKKHMFMVGGFHENLVYYLLPMRRHFSKSIPISYEILTLTTFDIPLRIIDDYTMDIKLPKGKLLENSLELMLGVSNNIKQGDLLERKEYTLQIVEFGDRGLTHIRIRFRKPLAGPDYVFITVKGNSLERLHWQSGENPVIPIRGVEYFHYSLIELFEWLIGIKKQPA